MHVHYRIFFLLLHISLPNLSMTASRCCPVRGVRQSDLMLLKNDTKARIFHVSLDDKTPVRHANPGKVPPSRMSVTPGEDTTEDQRKDHESHHNE
ncbi:uncharacterized protein LY79DRAFT_138493 [Colletotrichum navitas]|uniref:Secreted protein n=1 Tax=Colletotrichum navitas TaxID=681940 RepID=A0AAD8VBS9_9PEZI|nr:uncharacterized protein LY79DRAFT_138493 [Colletotrichum navitas]KAK1599331.1 hypothetical protein LY79DRAFT_138493 [Colletotrichum navitas]